MTLPLYHPAVVEGRSLFKKSANEHKRHKANILVSGMNSRKIGRIVTKGPAKGFPIFTLTLEERKTCPSSCELWRSCYGNRMPWSLRWSAGKETEDRIFSELIKLQSKYPKGFLVRLHVLGDFYSVEYVNKWEKWLCLFPALHVYGYTARRDEIGQAVMMLARKEWKRFSVRSSGAHFSGMPSAVTVSREKKQTIGVVCPVETGKTKTCGACALCWAAPTKQIVFLEH